MLILILLLMILGFFIPNQIIIINKFIAPNTCVLMYFNINFQLLKCAWYNFMWCSFFLFLVNSQVVKNRYPTSSMYFSYFIIKKSYIYSKPIQVIVVYILVQLNIIFRVIKHVCLDFMQCCFWVGKKIILFYCARPSQERVKTIITFICPIFGYINIKTV